MKQYPVLCYINDRFITLRLIGWDSVYRRGYNESAKLQRQIRYLIILALRGTV